MKSLPFLLSMFLILGSVACEPREPMTILSPTSTVNPTPIPNPSPTPDKGVFEKAGEKMDEGVHKTGEGFEKAGKEIKEGFKKAGDKLQGN